MLLNNDEKIENKNRMQPKEIVKKNNLRIDCPSFFPNNLKKYNISNDNSGNNVTIGLDEYINYFSCMEYKCNEEDKGNDLKNISLNTNAKEYIPRNKRANEDSEKIEYIEHVTSNKEEGQKKKEENSDNCDYPDLELSKEIKFKSYSNYSSSSKSSSSTNINVSIESWTKNDYPKEYKEEEVSMIKKKLHELLSKLKKDNDENIKNQIFENIKKREVYQNIFSEVFFYKVCMDSTKVELYAKLFKNLDKDLLQKSKVKEEGKRMSSKFRTKLIERCKKVFKGENYENFFQEEEANVRKNKLKKLIIGNTKFMAELIKIKMLSKKNVSKCIKFLFDKYKNEKDKVQKNTYIISIIIFIEKFEEIIHSGDKNMKEDELQSYKKSIDEMLKELVLIKKDEEKHIQYMINKLIEKIKKLNDSKEDEINQEYINNEIKRDLINYKDFIEKNGNSENYIWNITTELYDIKQKNFVDIIEGYFLACSYFIEKENNIKYAKDYIKELVEFYHKLINSEEKKQLQNKIFDLFDKAKDYDLNSPKIYNIYAYVIYLFIVYEIMNIDSLENIIKDTNSINKDDLILISNVYNYVYNYIQNDNDIFKKTLKKFVFIDRNKCLFKWVFESDLEREIVKNN